MKIGDKKNIKKGNLLISWERIKFDWKAAVVWLLVIGFIAWYFFMR